MSVDATAEGAATTAAEGEADVMEDIDDSASKGFQCNFSADKAQLNMIKDQLYGVPFVWTILQQPEGRFIEQTAYIGTPLICVQMEKPYRPFDQGRFKETVGDYINR